MTTYEALRQQRFAQERRIVRALRAGTYRQSMTSDLARLRRREANARNHA